MERATSMPFHLQHPSTNSSYVISASSIPTSSSSLHVPPSHHKDLAEENKILTKKSKKKAGGGGWVYVTHDPADPEALVNLLFEHSRHSGENETVGEEGGILVFRFEPLIVAVDCKDVASAQELVSTAISCGFRESGITSIQKRVMVAIRCSIRLEVPLGQIGLIMVTPEYVSYLVTVANEKMEANRQRTDGFLHVLQEKVIPAFSRKVTCSQIVRPSIIVGKNSLNIEAKRGDMCSEKPLPEKKFQSHNSYNNAFSSEHKEMPGIEGMSLSGVTVTIVGEPIEKLLLWGHSASPLVCNGRKEVVVYGGFGGIGQHARRNYTLLLDIQSGMLKQIDATESPSARVGHTITCLEDNVYLIGGRSGPNQIFNDVWVLKVSENRWTLINCGGSAFHPRHRHATAAVGSNVYVFGGLNNEAIYACLTVLNTESFEWSNVEGHGELPCARHSHSLVAYGPLLLMFGGFDGQKALSDFYSFDTRTYLWKREETSGRVPSPSEQNEHAVPYLMEEDENSRVSRGRLQAHFPDSESVFPANDILKKFGWLDINKRVYQSLDGLHICLPVLREFCDLYHNQCIVSNVKSSDLYKEKMEEVSVNKISFPQALEILSSCNASLVVSDVNCDKKHPSTPKKVMREMICSLLREKGLPMDMLDQLPVRWERLGDIVVLPVTCFRDPRWDSITGELWPVVAKSLGALRLARQGRILPTGTRNSTLEILVGDDSWVTHEENGIIYSFDATKCMFSAGNLSEKVRMANLDCRNEVVVDLFAGIGYFVLPFLVKAKAKLVYACEWNQHAVRALKQNVNANSVADRCIILEGDNRVMAPRAIADRVCLGLLPSSECSWRTAVKALRLQGGVLHIHGNVKDSKEKAWLESTVESIVNIAKLEGLIWDVSVQHVERVKSYGPRIRHLVADIKCRAV
ncbi:hypothetical protein HPP92_012029 [Vanilla planifolia]|uniref:SAM-dependent methyltransferase TRM5/TYW2-type domain-containing protein n=1 Tax=Vanilla planifolia TaxID=51239 RepID=A0A835R9L9_VANPL|nr:hypothetical protein HPP92_012029 [Vanilla planifolia]